MSKDTIKISPKYGVNPTICKCFYCGKDKSIALVGHIKKTDKNGYVINEDAEAPHEMIIDYEPCSECAEKMKNGFRIYGIVDKEKYPGMPEIIPGKVATKFIAITMDAANNLLDSFENLSDEDREAAMKQKGMLIAEEIFNQIVTEAPDETE